MNMVYIRCFSLSIFTRPQHPRFHIKQGFVLMNVHNNRIRKSSYVTHPSHPPISDWFVLGLIHYLHRFSYILSYCPTCSLIFSHSFPYFPICSHGFTCFHMFSLYFPYIFLHVLTFSPRHLGASRPGASAAAAWPAA